MEGIIIGTVTSNWNEEYPGMVQVEYTLGPADQKKAEWIPVMTPFGGHSYGHYCLPEISSTVVVAFEAGNGSRPVVLGSLWSQDNPQPADTANEQNSNILWKSKAGYTLLVEEQQKKISWQDPEGKNSLVWSTEDESLVLDVAKQVQLKIGGEDFIAIEKGSITINGAVTVAADSIKITTEKEYEIAAKDITLGPQQKLAVSGSQVEIKPSQSITLKAAKLEAEGTTAVFKGNKTTVSGTALELKAEASGKLNSSGIMEIKGSLLKLN